MGNDTKRLKRANENDENGVAATGGPSRLSRTCTLSVAVGASCIENAQSLELGTLLAGQIARACAIFNVDEIVVLDDCEKPSTGHISSAAALFGRVLQFMETPQYLRKALVPMHTDLRYAGMLPPLDAPHHLRASEWGHFREGIVTSSEPCKGSFVNVGLDKQAHLEQAVRQGARITIEMGSTADVGVVDGTEVYLGKLAAPADPRKYFGQYWGYYTRIAPSFDDLFNSSPYPGGYDLTIGTSERGEPVGGCDLRLKRFKHALIVIGGPQGLEYALGNDVSADKYPDGDPSGLFDRYLNTCHDQGSRTIRTEEALLITMAFLQPALTKAGG